MDTLSRFVCQNCFSVFSDTRPPFVATACAHHVCGECKPSLSPDFTCKVLHCGAAMVPNRPAEADGELVKIQERYADSFVMPKCLEHLTRKRILCLDPNCRSSRNFCCNNCFAEIHRTCSKKLGFDIERVLSSYRLCTHDIASLLQTTHKLLTGLSTMEVMGWGTLDAAIIREWNVLTSFEFRQSLDGNIMLILADDGSVDIQSRRLNQAVSYLSELRNGLQPGMVAAFPTLQKVISKINDALGCSLALNKRCEPHHTAHDPVTNEEKKVYCCLCNGEQFRYLGLFNDALERLFAQNSTGSCKLLFNVDFDTKQISLNPRVDLRLKEYRQPREPQHPPIEYVQVTEPPQKIDRRRKEFRHLRGKRIQLEEDDAEHDPLWRPGQAPQKIFKIRKRKTGRLVKLHESRSTGEEQSLPKETALSASDPENAKEVSCFEEKSQLASSLNDLNIASKFKEFFKPYLGDKITFVPIYQASARTFSAEEFHAACDVPNTLSFIYCEGILVGGYSDVAWASDKESSFYHSKKAFIFNLDLNTVYRVKESSTDYAIYSGKKFGPVFGDGADLCVNFVKGVPKVFSQLGSYRRLDGENTEKSLTGRRFRRMDRLEVFRVV